MAPTNDTEGTESSIAHMLTNDVGHEVLTVEEAERRLRETSFIEGIAAHVFLLFSSFPFKNLSSVAIDTVANCCHRNAEKR
jgi:hypothetical protein